MPQLEEMHEDDTFLEHLEGLKEHPGWLAYQEWLLRQEHSEIRAIMKHPTSDTDTAYIRGKIHAYRLLQNGLQILIDEHTDKLKEVRK